MDLTIRQQGGHKECTLDFRRREDPGKTAQNRKQRPTLVPGTLKLACFTTIGLVGSQENGFWMEIFDDHVRRWALVQAVLNL
jgi:hypothetical protein